MNHWYTHSSFDDEFRQTASTNVLLLVGPSGSGKTTLAEELSAQFRAFHVVKNTTTRRPRRNDNTTHFEYVPPSEFCRIIERGEFLLARQGELPYYGYRLSALGDAKNDGSILVFMFRNSGLRLFLERSLRPWVVQLVGEPEAIKLHSQDESENSPSIAKIGEQIEENEKLILSSDPNKTIRISNKFSGESEVAYFASKIATKVLGGSNNGQ